MTKNYLLRPFDKLFIKDGRPLSLEDDTAASGIFPPPPSVVFGAMRSGALAYAGAMAHGPQDPVASARVTGYALARGTDRPTLYFPAPNDLVRLKVKDESKRANLPAHRLQLAPAEDTALTSYPLKEGYLLTSPFTEQVESVRGYISKTGLELYLRNEEVPASELLPETALYIPNPKLGIGLDYRSGTTKDGMLYTMAMQYLCPDVHLCVGIEGFGTLTPMLRLGAESRAVELSENQSVTWPAPGRTSESTFSLYLATPAVFRNGWLPDAIDPETLRGEVGGAQVQLLAASLGRYQPLGGWDIVAKKPKPMRKAVPAGAVYHFRILGGEFTPAIIHGQSMHTGFAHSGRTDGSEQVTYAQQGFGITYYGSGPAALSSPN